MSYDVHDFCYDNKEVIINSLEKIKSLDNETESEFDCVQDMITSLLQKDDTHREVFKRKLLSLLLDDNVAPYDVLGQCFDLMYNGDMLLDAVEYTDNSKKVRVDYHKYEEDL